MRYQLVCTTDFVTSLSLLRSSNSSNEMPIMNCLIFIYRYWFLYQAIKSSHIIKDESWIKTCYVLSESY